MELGFYPVECTSSSGSGLTSVGKLVQREEVAEQSISTHGHARMVDEENLIHPRNE